MNNINFSIPQGELSAIIGRTERETTLFNLITGYHLPDSGRILLEGRDIVGKHPYISSAWASPGLSADQYLSRLSVLENMVATVISNRRGSLNMVTPFKS